jgi:hypothetical protein
MKTRFVLAFLACASPALAQEGDTTAAGKAIPQEEAMNSCTTQVESQNLPSDEQKKQWMMACLTGTTGTGPTPRAAPAEQHQKVCEQQRDYLKLSGGEGANFITACVERNTALLRKKGG